MSRPRISIIDDLKYCPFCDSEVEVAKFGYRSGTYDNLSCWCKPCEAEAKKFYRKFSPKYKAWYAQYYEKNRECIIQRSRERRWRCSHD